MKFPIIPTFIGGIALLCLLPNSYAQNSSLLLTGSVTCDDDCQRLVGQAISFEHDSHAHTPRDDFYGIPDTFDPSMKPGTLLRVEEHTDLTNYTVPSGLTMSRIMYTSQSLNGTIVPVSAFVLWPYAPFKYATANHSSSKFPLVAWAHGTAGQFVDCAPSNYRSLQYHFMTSYSLALEGFAVIATDYAGLGVTTQPDGEQTHTWLAGPASANDVAYAIQAVRTAFPDQLDPEGPFVTMGHSQGGNVAWAFAERQVSTPVAGYRGTVSISPPLRIIDYVEEALEMAASMPATSLPLWVPVVLNLQPEIIASITAVYPAYNFSGMTPLSYDRWNGVVKPLQGCLPTNSLAFAGVTFDQLAKPNWTDDSFVTEWQDNVAVGGKAFKGPLLVIVGDNDVVPLDSLGQSVDASCEATEGESLEMMTYSAMEHFPVIQASRIEWMRWIKAQVTARNYTEIKTCGKKTTVQGFNTNYTVQSISPNFLVSGVASPQEGWKFSL